MLSQDQLSQYLEGRLPELERPTFEARLAQDAEAQALLAEQQSMHFALAAVLAIGEDHQRVKRSIFTVLRAAPEAQLAADVMHTARASRSRPATPWHRAALQELIRAWEKLSEGSAWRTAAVAISLVSLVVISGVLWNRSLVPASIVLGHVTTVIGEPALVGRSQTAALLTTRQMIRTGDRLETGDADRVEIQFNDGTTLQLHFNTIVQIPKRPADRKDASALTRPPEVELVQGQVWTVVQKSTNGTPYAIRTDVATALALGTEFGVKVDRPIELQSIGPGTGGRTNATVLTVKEGTVEFFNAFGSVQATAMTESTARLGSAPTEPKRLQTLQNVGSGSGESWSIQTAALKPVEAAGRLVGGAFLSGLQLRDLPRAGGGGASGQTPVEVQVVRVLEQSPAERAGIEVGDVLEAIDGQPVLGAGQAEQMLMVRSSAIVNMRRQATLQDRDLTLSRANPVLPGPSLTEQDQRKLVALLQQWSGDLKAAALEKRRLDEAARISRAHLTRAAAFNNLGVFLELDDQLSSAVRAYGRAVYLDPESALYRMNLGLALRKMGSFERAYEELQSALSRVPDSSLLQTRVAELEALLGATSEALARVEAGLEKDPQSHNLWELKAQLHWRTGHLEAARAAAERAVQSEPDCVVAHSYLGGVLRDLGRLDAAEVAYSTALDIDPFHAGLHVEMGLLQQTRGDLAQAEESFRQAAARQPDFARAHRALGALLGDRQDFLEANAALDKAARLDPHDLENHLELGSVALDQGNLELAEEAYRTALSLLPENPDALLGMGRVYYLRRELAEAEGLFGRVTGIRPENATAWNWFGLVLHDLGRYEESELAYQRAIALAPSEAVAYHNLAELVRTIFRNLGEADALYRRSIELDPLRGGSYSGLGLTRARLGQFAEAEELLRKAIELEPGSSAFHNNLGEVLRQSGNYDGALLNYREALELDPANPNPYNNLGIIHSIRGEAEQAEQMYRAFLERVPEAERISAYANLALLLAGQGRLDEAEQFHRRALGLNPNNAHICNNAAWFLAEHRGALDEALALSRRAVDAAADVPHFLHTLGRIHLLRGEVDEAQRVLNRALERAGADPVAEEIRRSLNQSSPLNGEHTRP